MERAKDVGALQCGSPFAPQFIENKLKFSLYIREAVAFGHDRPFVVAMIAVDPGTIGTWAERRGVTYTSYMDLSQRPEVQELIRDEVTKCNATLPDEIKVRRFLLLAKELDADDAEMTRRARSGAVTWPRNTPTSSRRFTWARRRSSSRRRSLTRMADRRRCDLG